MAFKLPRFVSSIPIVKDNGTPTQTFHRWWQTAIERIETAINGIQDALDAAGIALAAADAAQTAADSVEAVAKLSNSGTDGLTLVATDAGSDVTINISAHTRLYGDGTSVSVNSGLLTGLSYSTFYYIYYDDSGFAGGAVTYVSTTVSADAVQTGIRHLVGSITTPAAAAPDTDGGVVRPPGQGSIVIPE